LPIGCRQLAIVNRQSTMPLLPPDPLVSTTWLAEHLGRPGLVVLDTSWYLPTSGRDARAEYRSGHIPGAVFFDLDAASDTRTTLPHMLPSAAEFGRYAGSLGVGEDAAVVVYDGSGTNLSAARAWWMFRVFGHPAVRVLDGGLGAWRREGRPLESGDIVLPPGVFAATLDPTAVRSREEVQLALATGAAQVVDLRPAGRFVGKDPEPRPGLPSGHMPGARSLPYTELVRPDGIMLPPDELERRLLGAGVDPGRPVIASCGSGTSACNLLLALERLGHGGGAVYDGSWTEWAGAGLPVARGQPA
jgi:thiosulfate/3-mercaptopyruvate sulfurtransferase